MDGMGLGLGWMDLCAGLLYEHRFAMLIINTNSIKINNSSFKERINFEIHILGPIMSSLEKRCFVQKQFITIGK